MLTVSLNFVVAETKSKDAYIIEQVTPSGQHNWTLGTSRVEKKFLLDQSDKFLPVSLTNKVARPPRDYFQDVASREFRVTINGNLRTGEEGGWA